MDESRKAFEEWFNPRKIAMQKRGISTIRIVRLHKKMLEAWQASRAAIEIELPAKIEREVRDTDIDDERRWGTTTQLETVQKPFAQLESK